jgi:hypothetical protein
VSEAARAEIEWGNANQEGGQVARPLSRRIARPQLPARHGTGCPHFWTFCPEMSEDPTRAAEMRLRIRRCSKRVGIVYHPCAQQSNFRRNLLGRSVHARPESTLVSISIVNTIISNHFKRHYSALSIAICVRPNAVNHRYHQHFLGSRCHYLPNQDYRTKSTTQTTN